MTRQTSDKATAGEKKTERTRMAEECVNSTNVKVCDTLFKFSNNIGSAPCNFALYIVMNEVLRVE